MKSCRRVAVALLAACLSGCGAAQLALPRNPLANSARAATSQSLLYVTDVGTNDVYVFTYPQGKLVQTLQGFNSPVRDCSDASGNVYITNTESQTILKFMHGGKKPVATLEDSGYLPWDCAVNSNTGTVAATAYGTSSSNRGSVAIYAGGKGAPKIKHAVGVQAYLYCTYDDQGDLFVDGLDYSYNFVLIELPRGKTNFVHINVKQQFSAWGGVKWDGKYLAIGDGISAIYDFAIQGNSAKRIHVVPLKGAVNVEQFALDGSSVVAPDGPNGANHDAEVWNYPKGGMPTMRIGQGLFKNPSGAAVSQ